MKLSFEYLNTWFHDTIYFHAIQHQTGIWSEDDIAQEVLIHLASVDWPNEPTPSTFHNKRICKTHPARVIKAIKMKCLNIRRYESYRLKSGTPSKLIPGRQADPASIIAIKDAIMTLDQRQTRCIRAKLFPLTGEATMRQIAHETGLSLATVSRTMQEARTLLETALSEENTDE